MRQERRSADPRVLSVREFTSSGRYSESNQQLGPEPTARPGGFRFCIRGRAPSLYPRAKPFSRLSNLT
jgi:hypothetical protein